MYLGVSDGAKQSLLFAGEEHKADGAFGFEAAEFDGLGRAQSSSDAAAVVSRAVGQVPGIKVPAHHHYLFGMLAASDFTDHIGRIDRAAANSVLHVDLQANCLALVNKTIDLLLVFSNHADDRKLIIGVKAERAGMREMHARGKRAPLPADDGDRVGLMRSLDELAEPGKAARV